MLPSQTLLIQLVHYDYQLLHCQLAKWYNIIILKMFQIKLIIRLKNIIYLIINIRFDY